MNTLLTEYDEKETMDYLYREAIEEGLAKGLEQGREKGKNLINKLNEILAKNNRVEDIIKAATDEEYQRKLMEEFHLD
ncbi:MAG: hypothetical protein ACI4LO_01860 [Anaerovoracaceae bacterium]